ncbi:polysaccharide biosynthesis/export family protein [Desertivirga xinjiangensis]|uniref:polysaccharide biosynthesis/export family protein n=1 Tax=Desertivirga xinjiangensis TaxID=539206 RepID=UPI00210EA922|nr:polysaccharide biosynthesis/export family protein [Pedobacter xinjiangensis]
MTSKTDRITDTLKSVFVVNDHGMDDAYYKIKPNDILALRNLQNIEFGAQAGQGGGNVNPVQFFVENDGQVNLPVIGKVKVGGLTRREAKARIEEVYSKELLKDPIIELSVVNLKVTVLGEFGTQGNYLLQKDNTTLVDILGESGGLTERADPKKLKIIRGDRANPEIIYVNLKNANSLASEKLILQNNDIIYAEPRKLYSTTESASTLRSFIQPALTVVNLALIIYNLSK